MKDDLVALRRYVLTKIDEDGYDATDEFTRDFTFESTVLFTITIMSTVIIRNDLFTINNILTSDVRLDMVTYHLALTMEKCFVFSTLLLEFHCCLSL